VQGEEGKGEREEGGGGSREEPGRVTVTMVEKEIRSNVDKCKSKLMTLVTPFITSDNINGQGKSISLSALPCWTAYGNESYV